MSLQGHCSQPWGTEPSPRPCFQLPSLVVARGGQLNWGTATSRWCWFLHVSGCSWIPLPLSFFYKEQLHSSAHLREESAWPGGWALASGADPRFPPSAGWWRCWLGSVGLLSKKNVSRIRQSCFQLGQQHGMPPIHAHAGWLSSCPQVTPEQAGEHPWVCKREEVRGASHKGRVTSQGTAAAAQNE